MMLNKSKIKLWISGVLLHKLFLPLSDEISFVYQLLGPAKIDHDYKRTIICVEKQAETIRRNLPRFWSYHVVQNYVKNRSKEISLLLYLRIC